MRKPLLIFLSLALAVPCFAQTDAQSDDLGAWLSVGLEKKLAKGLNAGIEGEYRLMDNMSVTDRWSVGAQLTYRLYRNKAKTFDIKAGVGYKYMNTFTPESKSWREGDKLYSRKDVNKEFPQYNLDEEYWLAKHRAYFTLSAGYEVGRFKFSLRERFQYTFNDSVEITEAKYRYSKILGGLYVDEDEGYETEWKGTNGKRYALRSRLGLDYNIPHCKIDPSVSVEFFNDPSAGMALQKTRWTAGLDYTLAKHHNFELYYAYQRESDGDEPGGHIVGLSYCFEF